MNFNKLAFWRKNDTEDTDNVNGLPHVRVLEDPEELERTKKELNQDAEFYEDYINKRGTSENRLPPHRSVQ